CGTQQRLLVRGFYSVCLIGLLAKLLFPAVRAAALAAPYARNCNDVVVRVADHTGVSDSHGPKEPSSINRQTVVRTGAFHCPRNDQSRSLYLAGFADGPRQSLFSHLDAQRGSRLRRSFRAGDLSSARRRSSRPIHGLYDLSVIYAGYGPTHLRTRSQP